MLKNKYVYSIGSENDNNSMPTIKIKMPLVLYINESLLKLI